MAPQTEFVSKTQLYLKVKKPMLERQRRARINKCLDTLKELVAHMQADDAILRMDKAEMLESILNFVKSPPAKVMSFPSGDSFRYGFMNAVNEVSRVMACTPGMNVDVGKAVMTHLGGEFNRVLNIQLIQNKTFAHQQSDRNVSAMSPASSGYQSEEEAVKSTKRHRKHSIWRPW